MPGMAPRGDDPLFLLTGELGHGLADRREGLVCSTGNRERSFAYRSPHRSGVPYGFAHGAGEAPSVYRLRSLALFCEGADHRPIFFRRMVARSIA
jgi:hypothetical protein